MYNGSSMKRINPDTGKHFRRGDIREDGYIFVRYEKSRTNKSTGNYFENWLSPKAWKTEKKRGEEYRKNRRNSHKQNPFPKRINPLTKKPFKYGDEENGMYFHRYNFHNTKQTGFRSEQWLDYEGHLKDRLRNSLNGTKRRALEKNIKFDIDLDYVYEIFPKNMICPVFNSKMSWGFNKNGSNKNVPTLDKIYPKKGYVRGNVVWISMKANAIKQDATAGEIHQVAEWLTKTTNQKKG